MEVYETEEQQLEALKRWWKANGLSTITGVIVGLLLITGWNLWRGYQQDKMNSASLLYEQLVSAAAQEKHESVERISQQLREKFAATAYAGFAGLLLAKSKVQQGDMDGAKAILQQLLRDGYSPEINNVARIRLVRLMLATADYETGLRLIAEADKSESQGFQAIYDELKGDLYLALDRIGEARTAYQSAMRSGQGSPLLPFKLDDISAADAVENPAP